MKKVNVFIVGAAKSGTTSLAEYLGKKQGFFLPEMKEPFYFIDDNIGIESLKEYEELYKKANINDQKIDASTGYLFDSQCAERIKNYNPDAKIIIVLRDPAKMVLSLWNYMKVNGVEKRSAEAALFEKDDVFSEIVSNNRYGWKHNYDYINRGLFYSQIKSYSSLFNNIYLCTLDDLISKPEESFKKLEFFLEQSFYNKNDSLPISNEGGELNSRFLHFLRQRNYPFLKKIIPPNFRAKIRKKSREMNTKKTTFKVTVEQNLNKRLNEVFFDDVELIRKEYNISFEKKSDAD